MKMEAETQLPDSVVDPGKRYPCDEGAVPARVFLKRGTQWPLVNGVRVLYRKSESSSAHWMGAQVVEVCANGFFRLQKS
jgi:hypothetical protein